MLFYLNVNKKDINQKDLIKLELKEKINFSDKVLFYSDFINIKEEMSTELNTLLYMLQKN